MPSPARILHQLLETDRLIGVEAAPRARFPGPEAPAAPSVAARAPATAQPRPMPVAPPAPRPVRPAPPVPAPSASGGAWQAAAEIPLAGQAQVPVDLLFVSVEWGPPLAGEIRTLFDRQVDAMRKLGAFTPGLLRLAWPGAAEPDAAALAEARAQVEAAIIRHKPRVAVLFGGFSAKAMVGAASLTLARGRWFTLGKDCAACATWHPSQLGVDRDRRMQTWEDLQKAMGKLKE